MQVGRKIYYELTTGNVIVDTGERQGDVIETTEAQDFQMYTALQPYQQSAVGVLQLAYGQDAQNFATYPYSVDITQTPPVVKWGTTPLGPTLADAQTAKIAQLNAMYQQALAAGFPSSASGTALTYLYDSQRQLELTQLAVSVSLGIAVYPVTVDVSTGTASLSQTQVTQLLKDLQTFVWAQKGQLQNLTAQVNAATTVAAVNAIAW